MSSTGAGAGTGPLLLEDGSMGSTLSRREVRLTTAEEKDFKLVRGRDGHMRKARLNRAEKQQRK